MSKTGAEIIGMQNVHRVLDQLPKRINRKLLNQTMRESLKPFITEVRTRAKSYSKRLGMARSFGILTKKEQPWGRKLRVPYLIAGARGKYGKLFNITEYGAYKNPVVKPKKSKVLKFVTKEGKTIFTKEVKSSKAHPILRPAADATRNKVSRDFMKIFRKKTKVLLNKMIKKYY